MLVSNNFLVQIVKVYYRKRNIFVVHVNNPKIKDYGRQLQ